MNRVVIPQESGSVDVLYKRGSADEWLVKTPADEVFWEFADPEASERTVEQLIRKKWSPRYNTDPDDFSDRS